MRNRVYRIIELSNSRIFFQSGSSRANCIWEDDIRRDLSEAQQVPDRTDIEFRRALDQQDRKDKPTNLPNDSYVSVSVSPLS